MDRFAYLPWEIISYPDSLRGWYKHAVLAGDKVILSEQIDAILSSSHPMTCHLIAKTLAEKHHIPWVADHRDLWAQYPYSNHCALRKFAEKRLELQTMNKASALVTVSKPLADDLSRLHTYKPVYVITNGFDPEDASFAPPELTNKFTITYTGALYDGKRDPSLLFEALKDLISDGIIDPDRVEVRFFGSQDPWLFDEIRDANLDGIVKVFAFVLETRRSRGSVSHSSYCCFCGTTRRRRGYYREGLRVPCRRETDHRVRWSGRECRERFA